MTDSLESGQVRHAFPAFRVFVYGQDITNYVLDVNVDWNTGRSPNVCSITLENNQDKFIFTTEDLKVAFNDIGLSKAADEYFNTVARETIDRDDITAQIFNNLQTINFELKRKILTSKFKERIKGVVTKDINGEVPAAAALRGDALRYPLQAEDPIFHPNDPIRIFFRDPLTPSRWYHMFCGFLTNYDDNVDSNNQRILTLHAEGPSKLLRLARMATNPTGFLNRDALATEFDAIVLSFYVGGFTDLTLPEILFIMIFGNDPEKELTKFTINRALPGKGTAIDVGRFSGVGQFNFSRSVVVDFGPESQNGVTDAYNINNIPSIQMTDLSQYQSLIDHEVKVADLIEMLGENVQAADRKNVFNAISSLPRGENDKVSIPDVITYLGENPKLYPVDGGRLILLLPASLSAKVNREVLTREITNDASLNTEFRSRLGIIYDVIERIDFVFYESPKGDLICEFPLYDFDPDDFGSKTVSNYDVVNGQLRPSHYNNDTERGPFNSRYKILKHDTYDFNRQFSDEKVRTQMAVTWELIKNRNLGNSGDIQDPEVVTLSHLIPLYGVRLEQVAPKGFMSTREGARLYGHTTLNKMNADAKNIGINAVANFGLCLNRPLFFAERFCVATTVGLSHNIKWGMGGSADTRVNLNSVRGWDGLLKNGKPAFTPMGGMPSRPLNYKVLFGLEDDLLSGNNTELPSSVETTENEGIA